MVLHDPEYQISGSYCRQWLVLTVVEKNHTALKARLPRVYHHESIYVEHHGD